MSPKHRHLADDRGATKHREKAPEAAITPSCKRRRRPNIAQQAPSRVGLERASLLGYLVVPGLVTDEGCSVMSSVFTIGHSNHAIAHFLGLLALRKVEVLVDVRSSPASRFSPHFDESALRASLLRVGVRYLSLGRECGGRPAEGAFYDDEGYVRYDRVAASERFGEGIRRLETGITRFRVALMCSEEDPLGCHRRLLIGRVLMARGIEVRHLRGDGRVETEREVALRETPQAALFEEAAPAWRSIRPASAHSRAGSPSRR